MTDRWTGSCLMLGACCPSLYFTRKEGTDDRRAGKRVNGVCWHDALPPSLSSFL